MNSRDTPEEVIPFFSSAFNLLSLSHGFPECSKWGVGGSQPLTLTLHVYTDGLDGSHPDAILRLAVVAAALHACDAHDP